MRDENKKTRNIAEVDNLKIHFNSKRGLIHAVDGVSFSIEDGETLGLVGETGCGKSVTGRSFIRLLPMPPAVLAGGNVMFQAYENCEKCGSEGCENCEGTGRYPSRESSIDLLTINDEKIRKLRGDRIAMIFQDPGKALNPTLTIGAQIGEVFLQHRSTELLELAGLQKKAFGAVRRLTNQNGKLLDRISFISPNVKKQKKLVDKALEQMISKALSETQIPNPAKMMDRYPHELSGGMKQRVMIAQALACNPDLLIADEPTTALDVTVEAKILELIRELQKRKKTSVLYISHDLSLVRRICDRVAVMYAGRVVEIGRTEDIFSMPQHPYTKGLMAAVPAPGIPRGKLAAIKGTVPELISPPLACRFSGRCPQEFEVCRASDPELKNISKTHSVACFRSSSIPSVSVS